ncbi:SusC/RagA family TonB-linked outer membrane protein [Natronoflexus pectinivorans]|uniref:TonB-linked SusC/RagA family outer membrane protein n=1 Tax=Natronoflexus pectinivorans TaxID=682526 RepID=A0A4R2GNX5_9BACT|nr:TonB-dependent receptor [Natronoflexus pectinivorans]TCO10800.1 TonB-linked SusC/RagA family outer membrane protein [Natronoflexus pectinivorans]
MTKNLRLLFFLCLLSGHLMVFGQTRTVTGTVTDNTNDPLPGVSIIAEGTTIGTVTDIDGNYQIALQSDQNTLVFSFIGYDTRFEEVAGRSVINVVLEPADVMLDEFVMVGYGGMRKSDISGASVSVGSDQIRQSISANLDQALQGRAAGVTAMVTSGQPGASVSVRIRGQGTLNASAAEPLYVIDGVPVQNVSQGGHSVGLGDRLGNAPVSTFGGGLSSINPADIVSMEILKDASATAIYGSRGANGVVLITTRRGQTGEARFDYEFNYGIQHQAKHIDVMNLREFAEYSNSIAAETAGRDPRVELLDPTLLGRGTDWQDAVFRTAPMQSHQISASGGTESARYYVSGSYFTQEGTVIGSDYERFTGRVNLDADLKRWWTIGTNISLSRSEDNLGLNNSEEGIINIALRSSPDVPIYNVDGTWSGDEREGSPGSVNPIAKALDEEIRLKRTNLLANVYSDITITDGLVWRSEVALDLGYTNAYTFQPTYRYGNVENISNSSRWQFNQNTFWELKNYVTYNRSFDLHNATMMAGQEVSEWKYEFLSGSSTGLPSNEVRSPQLGQSSSMNVGSGFGSGAMASFFSRANYNYDNRYYATYTFRYDGSSNFGPENRWAPFHATSVMWRVSNEAFWDGMSHIVSNFRIRGGWGQTGNSSIGGYRWGASITSMPTGLGTGYRQTNIANPFVQWEKQEQYNLGFDVGFINNRIDLVLELYQKTSTDMLMELQLPSYMGTRGNASSRLNPPMGNFGEIENKGIEITLNTRPVVGRFQWDSNVTFTMNKNKLLGLGDSPSAHIEGYGQWTDVVSLTTIGQSLYGFYGYQVAGIYTSKEDILNSPRPEAFPGVNEETGELLWNRQNTVWVGDIKFKDISGPDGKPDGVIDQYDRTFLGSPWPKFTFGFANTFSYRNFDLSVFLHGTYGNKILNYVGRSLTGMNTMWNNQLATMVDRTTLRPINPDQVYLDASGNPYENWFNDIDNVQIDRLGKDNTPRAITGDPNNNRRISDRYIEDGSYIRIQNITLGYNIPAHVSNRWGLSNVRVYTNLQNMWTFTKYSGFDPEIGASQTSSNVYGLDNGRYPSPRIYSFGVNVSF